MNNYLNIEDIIAKHLSQESSKEEEQLLASWLTESESNRNYIKSLEKIYNESASLKITKNVDTDAAWNKLKAKIEQQQLQTGKKGKIVTITPEIILRVAAILILVAGIGFTLYLKMKSF